ncbi:MAG: hypothetical protein PHI24_09150 [Desulfitobacteriaceae bacterium]|nr:hypothetical protein [Desulfitobacteriaceae bacterium]
MRERCRLIEIWSEGYIVTGNHGFATLHGKVEAHDLKEACDLFAASNQEFAHYYDANNMRWWGCRIFDNWEDALKSYG